MGIQEVSRPGNNAVAPYRVVGAAALCTLVFRDRIGAVQCVIEAAPTGIRGVKGIARIHDRHHQLRPGNVCDFSVYVLGADRERFGFGVQVADFAEKGLISGGIEGFAFAFSVPLVYLLL